MKDSSSNNLVRLLIALCIGCALYGCGSGLSGISEEEPFTPSPPAAVVAPATATIAPTILPSTPALSPTIAPPIAVPATATALPTATRFVLPTATVKAAETKASPPVATVPPLSSIPRQPLELQAAWVHDNSFTTQEKADEIIRRAELGHINAIFANVFTQGEALFDSSTVAKSRQVKDNFNPLAYLVQEAHKRRIQVHAWFVNGPVDHNGESAIIQKHPDWAQVGADGETLPWLNLARPEVRRFLADLMMETVTRYGVDGIHFDFTRYPGPQWGFDQYTADAFNDSHDFDVNELRYADLPAYAFFEGNPLIHPTTAQVLATFADGVPALTLNTYGAGSVLMFNWRASERHLAVESEILKRAVQSMSKSSGQVYLFHPDSGTGNSEDYFAAAQGWLTDLGWQPQTLDASQVLSLPTDAVVIMPDVYALNPTFAWQIASFVQKGGGLIFIEGPSRSLDEKILQELTGMAERGKRFEGWTVLGATRPNPLLPTSSRSSDVDAFRSKDAAWKTFRKDIVTSLVREVHQRLASEAPNVELTVTITPQQENAANQVMQDWHAWLDEGLINFLIPRSYVPEVEELDPIISTWQPAMQQYNNIVLGLSTFTGKGKERIPKEPAQLLDEIQRVEGAGSKGIMLWNLDYLSDEELKALADGPFRVSTASR